jgi:hypothetical protein
MPAVTLRKIVSPQPISSDDIFNIPSPLSYQKWIENNYAVIPEQATKQYEQYKFEIYKKKQQTISEASTKIKDDYVAMIKQLSTVFRDDPEFTRFTEIDFESPTEVKIAIPFFARKLKEIALYYVTHRENLKNTKLHYSTIGSETGVERFLYNNLLSLFTRRKLSTNRSNTVVTPDLSAISDTFNIEIEELFDTTNYFHEEGLDINPLFCVLENYISDFCDTPNSFSVDIYNNPLEALNLCDGDIIDINELTRVGWQKYLGNDLYYISGGGYIPTLTPVSLNLQTGNNFFYWFSGTTVSDIPEGRFATMPISAIDWDEATGAGSFSAADIIFVSYGNLKTEGAWLMTASNYTFQTEMTATIDHKRHFKFPYPGIGLSAESGDWSGRLITDTYEEDKRFFPNEVSYQDTQTAIEELYWKSSNTASAVEPLSIQNTNLWEQGAYASTRFKDADKIITRPSNNVDIHPMVDTGNTDISWLYKFEKTQIPIRSGTNNLYYPLTAFNELTDLYFEYESGTPIPLSAIPTNESFAGAIAGTVIDSADIITRLRAPCGPAIQAAWLRGQPLSYLQNIATLEYSCGLSATEQLYTDWKFISGSTQPGISFIAEPGKTVRFVWCGENTDINDIRGFTGFEHDAACPYHQLNHESSILDVNFLTINDSERFEKWKKCTCKAVHYSPLGHRSTQLEFMNIVPDFIAEETNPEEEFNAANWRGFDGKPFNTSNNVAFFTPNSLIEKDLGWNKGQWRRPDGSKFVLQQGVNYYYHRSDLESCNYTLPPFIINQGYTPSEISSDTCEKLSNIPTWYTAVQNTEGEWVDGGTPSEMILTPGSFYQYLHRDSHTVTREKLLIDGLEVNAVSGSLVDIVDNLVATSYKNAEYATPTVNFLIKINQSNNKPYWGKASYADDIATRNKLVPRNSEDNREEYEYLQLNQPIPSDVILTDQLVIQYELSDCNSCFIWKQPITMKVDEPISRWNKIIIDECVQSDILDYLHSQANNICDSYNAPCFSECQAYSVCGCDDLCESSKMGVTASPIPADILLNTELSGIPLYVNYFSRKPYTLNFNVNDLTRGDTYVAPTSGILAKAEVPWRNLLNDQTASFAHAPTTTNLKTSTKLGHFVPSRVGIGKYELYNAAYVLSSSDNDIDVLRSTTPDYPYKVTTIDSTWMKDYIGRPRLAGHQSYYPYTNSFATNIFDVSSAIVNWQTDIYGNQFILLGDSSSSLNSRNIGSLNVKDIDGNLHPAIEFLSPILEKYHNISFGSDGPPISGVLATDNGYLLSLDNNYVLVLG